MLRSFTAKTQIISRLNFSSSATPNFVAATATNRQQMRFNAEKPSAASTTASSTPKEEPKKSGFLTETKKEKLVAGALGATVSSMSVLGVCHLLVCEVPLAVAGGSVGGAALTGALGVFEGEGSGGSGFGTAIGIFLGGVGAWYAKTSTEPWSKAPAK